MVKNICLVLLFIFPFIHCHSQVLPKEGSELNYRIIGFSLPQVSAKVNYVIEIAKGNYYSEDSFIKNIVVSESGTTNKLITEVPFFGCQYTWRAVFNDNKSLPPKVTALYHFSTGIIPQLDTNYARIWTQKRAEKYQDAYFFMDGTRALYNMDGQPVWYLPNVVPGMIDLSQVRDMKITPQGTITFILSDAIIPEIIEINYDGTILWKGPNDGKVANDNCENYHHEFNKLSNGNYMVMGTESIQTKFPGFKRKLLPGMQENNDGPTKNEFMIRYGTVIEYDKNGTVVWSWKSSSYFSGSDILNYRNPISGMPEFDLLDNSFYFDEKDKIVYISFKNISRIIKVKYPEGNVVNVFGEIFQPDVPAKGNGLFAAQHSCSVSADGNLVLYSNLSNKKNKASEILLMKESGTELKNLSVVWEYECPFDTKGKNGKYEGPDELITTGGNVTELPDNSFFVSECNPYGYLFIVDREKQLLYKAQPIKLNIEKNVWEPFTQFKANIIPSKKDFEKLLWNN